MFSPQVAEEMVFCFAMRFLQYIKSYASVDGYSDTVR